VSFDHLFQTTDTERQQFLAGLFGLLSAEIIRCWGTDKQARYTLSGVPLLREIRGNRGYTLDYALQTSRRLYVAVMKCDPVADGPLQNVSQLEAHDSTKSFAAFLDAAQHPANYIAVIDGEELPIAGAILIWGSSTVRAQRAIKKQYGVPANLASCHTTIVDDYVVEGHIPAEDVQRLLAEKPDIAGIAVPGMPIGSPGMESGDYVEPYTVFSFTESGETAAFAEHS